MLEDSATAVFLMGFFRLCEVLIWWHKVKFDELGWYDFDEEKRVAMLLAKVEVQK